MFKAKTIVAFLGLVILKSKAVLVVIEMLVLNIVEHIPTQHKRHHTRFCKMLVNQTIGIIPLGRHRQITQYISLLINKFRIHFGVQCRIVTEVEGCIQLKLIDGP